jgi:hypothetical protein
MSIKLGVSWTWSEAPREWEAEFFLTDESCKVCDESIFEGAGCVLIASATKH